MVNPGISSCTRDGAGNRLRALELLCGAQHKYSLVYLLPSEMGTIPTGTLHTGSYAKCSPGCLAAVMYVATQPGEGQDTGRACRRQIKLRLCASWVLELPTSLSVTNGMQVQLCYVEATVDKLSRCVWEPLFFRATRLSSRKQVKKGLQGPVPSPPHLHLPHSVPQRPVVWDSSHKGPSLFVAILSPATAVRYVSHVAL